MAITSALSALFGQLPGPLVYGYLYDVSCTLFRDHDTDQGDCLQYDIESVKNYVMRFSAAISIIPLLADVVLVFVVRNLDLYLEPPIKFDPSGEDESGDAETSV